MISIIPIAKQHCISLLEQSRCGEMPYHNMQHTREVYRNVQLIGVFESLRESDIEILKLAALFHDTGLSKTYLGHEALSAENAKLFLESNQYPKLKIDKVITCIKATLLPQQPHSILENVICDADLFHLSSDCFLNKNQLLRNEWEQFLNKVYTDMEWNKLNLGFLKNHEYHSEFGKTVLEKGKRPNLKILRSVKKELEY